MKPDEKIMTFAISEEAIVYITAFSLIKRTDVRGISAIHTEFSQRK